MTGKEAEPKSPYLWTRASPYDNWVESTGLPVYDGHFIPDARTIAVARWDERECDAAFREATISAVLSVRSIQARSVRGVMTGRRSPRC